MRTIRKLTVFGAIGLLAWLFLVFVLPVTDDHIQNKVEFYVEGRSMEQYGINDGEYIETVLETPNLNDTVVFDCMKPGCEPSPYIYIKKLTDVREDGCYWLEGNKKAWYDTKDRIWHESIDSRKFGWLCPGQINIQGVIHETKNYTKGEAYSK